VVFGKHFSAIAEYELLASHDGKHVALLAKAGDGGPWEIYFRLGGKWTRIAGKTANARGAAWEGDRLLVESFQNAPRGKVIAINAFTGRRSLMLAQQKGALQR